MVDYQPSDLLAEWGVLDRARAELGSSDQSDADTRLSRIVMRISETELNTEKLLADVIAKFRGNDNKKCKL